MITFEINGNKSFRYRIKTDFHILGNGKTILGIRCNWKHSSSQRSNTLQDICLPFYEGPFDILRASSSYFLFSHKKRVRKQVVVEVVVVVLFVVIRFFVVDASVIIKIAAYGGGNGSGESDDGIGDGGEDVL